MEEYERAEQDRMEEKQAATKKLLEKMKQDESHRSFEGSSGVHSDGEDLDDTDDDAGSNLGEMPAMDGVKIPGKSARPSGPKQTRWSYFYFNRTISYDEQIIWIYRRVYGNMTGLEDDDSLDSDSDMLLDGDSNDSDEDDELEVNEAAAETLKNRKSAKLAKAIDNNSDDDF